MITGVVQEIKTRSVPGKFGRPGTVYDIVLTNGQQYSAGFKSPLCSPGDEVSFEVSGKFNNVDAATLRVNGKSAGGAPTSSPPAKASYGGGGGGGFPIETSSREFAIIRQNALTNAVAAVGHFYGNGCIAIWEGGDANFNNYTDKIIEVAYKFADFSSGQREVKALKDREGA